MPPKKKISLRRANEIVPVFLPDTQAEKRAWRREEKRVCAAFFEIDPESLA